MKISVLIPCHNEEKSIEACINSCLNQTRKPDEIVVVNDGSTDASPEILKKFGDKIKVIDVYPATGNKSYAQEIGLKQITGDVFVCTDGDTIIDSHFVERVAINFKNKKVGAMGGYVKSLKYNWLTLCRSYEYSVGQNIHKLAQHFLDFMLVIPGAAGAFRTKAFKKYVKFDHDTLTEDLDFTYKLNKKGVRIAYDRKAIVYTQDPKDLNSYINQMRRWYGGGWQNLAKHLDKDLSSDPRRVLELTLIYVEGFVYSIVLWVLPIINLTFSIKILALTFLLTCLQAIYAAYKEKRAAILLVPFLYLPITYINSGVFIEQFFKEFLLRKRSLVWFQPERVSI